MKHFSRWNWAVVALVVWVGLILAFAVHAAIYPWSHTVYAVYAVAARNWWEGRNLYAEEMYHYRYSPLFAVAMTPFSLLPQHLGTPVWKVLNVLCYAGGLWAWGRKVIPARLSRDQLAALFLLGLPLGLQSMYNGQANLLCIGILMAGLADVAARRWNRAAGLLAAATLIKGYPLALAALLCVNYPRRFAARFAVALGLGFLLPFAAQRPSVVAFQYRAWFDHLQDDSYRERYRSLDHLFRIYHHPLSLNAFALMGLLAGAAVLGLCLLHSRQTADPQERMTRLFNLFAAWVVLFGPATECCTYVIIAPAVAWQLIDAFSRRGAWATRLLLIASLLLMGFLGTDVFGSAVRTFAIDHGSQPVGALLFLALLLAQTSRRYGPATAATVPVSASLEAAA